MRLFKHVRKIKSFTTHFRKDEIGRAIDDSRDPLDPISRQALAQRFDDGDTTSNGCFKCDYDAFGRSGSKNLSPMHCQQSLVGGHHMFARSNGFQHQRLGNSVATNQLNDDINIRIRKHCAGIIHHRNALTHDGSSALNIQIGHHRDFNSTPCASLNFRLIAFQHIECSGAYHTDAQ